MVHRVSVIEEAQEEFLVLRPSVRLTFERAFAALRGSSTPFVTGEGYSVEQLRLREELWPQGVFMLHVHGAYRGFFIVDRGEVVFGGFGVRPGFYTKMRRLRAMMEGRSAE